MESIQKNLVKTDQAQEASQEIVTSGKGKFGAKKTEITNTSSGQVFMDRTQEGTSLSDREARHSSIKHKEGLDAIKGFLGMQLGGQAKIKNTLTLSGEKIISTLEQCRAKLIDSIRRDDGSVLRFRTSENEDSLILSIIGDKKKQDLRKTLNACIDSIKIALKNNHFRNDILKLRDQEGFFVVTSEIKQKIELLTSQIERYGGHLDTKYARPLKQLLNAGEDPIRYDWYVENRGVDVHIDRLSAQIAFDLLLEGDFDKDSGLFCAVTMLKENNHYYIQDMIKRIGKVIKLESCRGGNADNVQLIWAIFSVLGYWAYTKYFMEHYAEALKAQKGIDLYNDDTFIQFVCDRVKNISELVEIEPDHDPQKRRNFWRCFRDEEVVDRKRDCGYLLKEHVGELSSLATNIEKTRFALEMINQHKPQKYKCLYDYFCMDFSPLRTKSISFVDLLEREALTEQGRQ